jgi:hypothetical protein
MRWSGWTDWPVEPRAADLRPMGEGRSPGLHLGSIIRSMKVAVGEKVEGPQGDQEGVRIQEGFLWETALEYMACGMPLDQAMDTAFKRYMVKCREGVTTQVAVEKDGIHMTPDAFNAVTGELESYKVTRRTLRKAKTQEEFCEHFWPWLVQEQSYCYALGVDTVRWIVLWQAGDYGKGVGSAPVVLSCTAVFTPEELVTNWQTVLKHAEGLRKEDV